MRFLAMIIAILAPCQAANILIEPLIKPKKVIKARITAYWAHPRQDEWTSRYESSTGKRLISGKTCAVDPKIIKYGSRVKVNGKTYVAKDTGTAVVAKKASYGKAPVIDLFFSTQKQAIIELNRVGRYAWVEVEN